MSIFILCPSPLLKDDSIKTLCNDYIKRLSQKVEIIEVKAKEKSNESPDTIKNKQANALITAIEKLPQNTAVIALDEKGKLMNSPEFSKQLNQYYNQGYSHLCVIIGGAFGLSPDIYNRANLQLSLGKMVWPHKMVAPMILEQLYRAETINSGHPYHKD